MANYYQNFVDQYQPLIDREAQSARAAMADKGLTNSTAGQDYVASQRQKMLANATELGENARQYDSTLTENQRQFNTTSAENARQFDSTYKLDTDRFGESKRQFDSTYALDTDKFGESKRQFKVNSAYNNSTLAEQINARKQTNAINAQQGLWGMQTSTMGLSKKQKKAAKFGYSSGYKKALKGDPPEQGYNGTIADAFGAFDGTDYLQYVASKKQAERSSALQAASLALDRQKFAYQKQQAALANSGDSALNTALDTASALYNTQLAKDSKTNGLTNSWLPSELFSRIQGETGLDIETLAKQGNARAIGIYRSMYPNTWQQRLDGDYTPTATRSSAMQSTDNTSLTDRYMENRNSKTAYNIGNLYDQYHLGNYADRNADYNAQLAKSGKDYTSYTDLARLAGKSNNYGNVLDTVATLPFGQLLTSPFAYYLASRASKR